MFIGVVACDVAKGRVAGKTVADLLGEVTDAVHPSGLGCSRSPADDDEPALVILGLLAGDGCVAKHHLLKRRLFAYVTSSYGVTRELRAIRPRHRCIGPRAATT